MHLSGENSNAYNFRLGRLSFSQEKCVCYQTWLSGMLMSDRFIKNHMLRLSFFKKQYTVPSPRDNQ